MLAHNPKLPYRCLLSVFWISAQKQPFPQLSLQFLSALILLCFFQQLPQNPQRHFCHAWQLHSNWLQKMFLYFWLKLHEYSTLRFHNLQRSVLQHYLRFSYYVPWMPPPCHKQAQQPSRKEAQPTFYRIPQQPAGFFLVSEKNT